MKILVGVIVGEHVLLEVCFEEMVWESKIVVWIQPLCIEFGCGGRYWGFSSGWSSLMF